MKKSLSNILFFGIIMAPIIFGCHKGKESTQCLSYFNEGIISVSGPDSGLVNQTLDFNVSFGVGSVCGHFNGFQETSNGDTTVVSVNIKNLGCVCPALGELVDSVYKFTATATGVHYLKFLQSESSYILDTLKIR